MTHLVVRLVRDHVAPYDVTADLRADEYDRLDPEKIYAQLLPCLPRQGGDVLDVGAGSGRDALWLAGKGYRVVAVEPAQAMRAHILRKAQGRDGIDVRDGLLPALATVGMDERFDLILLGAVWQHVPPRYRKKSFDRLAACLKPGGVLFILLRQGPASAGRKMYRVSVTATARMARACGLETIVDDGQARADMLSRDSVSWRSYAARKPAL